MARGKTTDAETIYNVMASYFITRSFAQTSRDLDMPLSTVENLVKAHMNDKEFIELWNTKKEDFVNKVDVIIYQAIDRLTKEMDKQENIPINQLTTAIGTLYDKKLMAQTGVMGNDTPSVQINIVSNDNLEESLYEEDEE